MRRPVDKTTNATRSSSIPGAAPFKWPLSRSIELPAAGRSHVAWGGAYEAAQRRYSRPANGRPSLLIFGAGRMEKRRHAGCVHDFVVSIP